MRAEALLEIDTLLTRVTTVSKSAAKIALASASRDRTVKIWDVAEARCVGTLGDGAPAAENPGHGPDVNAHAVLDAGRLAPLKFAHFC